MRRYLGFDEWLLRELGEDSGLRRQPVGPVKASTLRLVDQAAAKLRFRDEVWQANREKIFEEWKRDRPTLTLAEFVDQICEQIRTGKE